MRRLFSTIVLVGSLLLATAVGALADAPPEIERIDLPLRLESPCTGDIISGTGTLQVVRHLMEDPGDSFHTVLQGTLQDARGVGAGGTPYRVTGGFHFLSKLEANFVFNQVSAFTLISQGGQDNFVTQLTLKLTYNANGELVAEVQSGSTECRG